MRLVIVLYPPDKQLMPVFHDSKSTSNQSANLLTLSINYLNFPITDNPDQLPFINNPLAFYDLCLLQLIYTAKALPTIKDLHFPQLKHLAYSKL